MWSHSSIQTPGARGLALLQSGANPRAAHVIALVFVRDVVRSELYLLDELQPG
jgi:hypothetical protein